MNAVNYVTNIQVSGLHKDISSIFILRYHFRLPLFQFPYRSSSVSSNILRFIAHHLVDLEGDFIYDKLQIYTDERSQ